METIPRGGPAPAQQMSQNNNSGSDNKHYNSINKFHGGLGQAQRYKEEFTLNLQSIDPVIGNQNQTDDFGKKPTFNQYQTIDANPSILSPMHHAGSYHDHKRSNAHLNIRKVKQPPSLSKEYSKQSFDKRVQIKLQKSKRDIVRKKGSNQ